MTATQDSSGNGADGFRCDAIKHVETSWLNDLRTKLNTDVIANQNPKQRFYMVGETFDFDDSTNDGNGRDFIKSFVNPTTLLDGQFDFPLRLHAVNALLMRKEGMDSLAGFMDSNDYFYGADAIMSPFLGNHDLPRMIHLAQNTPLWGDQGSDGKHYDDGTEANFSNQPQLVTETEAYERVANGFALLYTNRGAPLVYYGDEYGMPGAGDPDNRRFMQWERVHGEPAVPPRPHQDAARDPRRAPRAPPRRPRDDQRERGHVGLLAHDDRRHGLRCDQPQRQPANGRRFAERYAERRSHGHHDHGPRRDHPEAPDANLYRCLALARREGVCRVVFTTA